MTWHEVRQALLPVLVTGAVSVIGTFMVTVNKVEANGEQGKQNEQRITELQTKVATMDGKLGLIIGKLSK